MNETDQKEEKVILDGKEVTQEQLQEVQSQKNVRLHQEGEGNFRTLHRLAE